jgi:phosphopentomutase
MKRVIIIVLDSLGIGALPDASLYGDEGSNTLGSILKETPDLKIPHLIHLGLGNIDGVKWEGDLPRSEAGSYGRLAEASKGKDTITGHWEIAGIYTEEPFKTYPEGFPASFMEEFETAIGMKTLGNYPASGTEIIEELGPLHEETGNPIVYTSADSVFQIAANVDVIPLNKLYEICEIARKMLVGDVACGRVIARPYEIMEGKRIRTSDRKDYAVSPPEETLLDKVVKKGMQVHAIGKISDIFNGQGITHSIHTESNQDGMQKTEEALETSFEGLIFTNLVDFDSKFGHRRDAEGYGKALEEFDARLPHILKRLQPMDLLMICADHGNDPDHTGWDHTREYVPVVVTGKPIKMGVNMGTRSSFGDIAATISEYLNTEPPALGTSFLSLILETGA